MFDGLFQPTHLLLILIIVLIVFGPGKLPELGRALGQSIHELRRASAATQPPAEAGPAPAQTQTLAAGTSNQGPGPEPPASGPQP